MKYKMGLQKKYFELVNSGEKTVELRLNDDKRKKIKVGDIIEFSKEPERVEHIDTIVDNLFYYKNFDEALNSIDIKSLTNEDKGKYLKDLEKYYPREKQDKYGVVAIKISSKIKREKSCGVLVLKEENDKKYFLLIHHNLGHWGIPKGHVEKNETEEETAIREVKEETNVDVSIINGFRTMITYSPKDNVLKDVIFFIGTPTSFDLKNQEEEVMEVRWVELEKCEELITHEDEKNVVLAAMKFLQELKK